MNLLLIINTPTLLFLFGIKLHELLWGLSLVLSGPSDYLTRQQDLVLPQDMNVDADSIHINKKSDPIYRTQMKL